MSKHVCRKYLYQQETQIFRIGGTTLCASVSETSQNSVH